MMCRKLTERRACAEEARVRSELVRGGDSIGVGSTQPGPTHDLTVREAVSSLVRDRVTVRVLA